MNAFMVGDLITQDEILIERRMERQPTGYAQDLKVMAETLRLRAIDLKLILPGRHDPLEVEFHAALSKVVVTLPLTADDFQIQRH